jgi:hypothetical protein
MLHAGVRSRPRVLTVPAMLRTTFYQNAQALLRPCMRGGVRWLGAVFSRVSGTSLTGGDIVVVQPQGRHGHSNPHVPMMATSGGWDQQAEQWGPLA